jgi:hypothetical protein
MSVPVLAKNVLWAARRRLGSGIFDGPAPFVVALECPRLLLPRNVVQASFTSRAHLSHQPRVSLLAVHIDPTPVP